MQAQLSDARDEIAKQGPERMKIGHFQRKMGEREAFDEAE